ncbi:DUF1499 domain-containing protein [Candidatus Cyanaurora vandensis]|uniref:DUF1499 domain-containing protein n=1 Tax=Candidatus Cyanaurora vandensis TaxID=2714958 RepID=UPI00257A2540|nr:DUF1499 domain-containing protein [Candidatus Cyanaurora vandensis]
MQWLVRLLVASLSLSLMACGSSTNSAQTGEPGLEPRVYTKSSTQVFQAAQQAFTTWPRGKGVLAQDAQAGTVHGYSQTDLWKFTDDVYVTIRAESPTQTRVEVRSKGRMGQFDFGGNARNIKEYLLALDGLLN